MVSLASSASVEGVRIGHLTSRPSHPLDDLVDGVRSLSEDAFRRVHEAMADDLTSFAFSMVSDAKTAEDIVQDAFVELVRAAPKLRGSGASLRTWLYRSVRYGCLDEYRRRARRPERPSSTLPDQPAVPIEDPTLDPRLANALAKLTNRHRTLLALKYVGGLSGKEIAGIMGIGRKAVYSATERAEHKLRLAWEASDE